MAVRFYLNQIDNQHEIFCDTNSTFTEIAGSFNIGTIELEWNTNKHAIFPYTKLFIVDTESNNKWGFVVSQDNVSVVNKLGTTKYLHTLTVSQNTHKLNNHLLRNTRFQQPVDHEKHLQRNTLFSNEVHWVERDDEWFCNYQINSKIYNFNSRVRKSYSIDFSETRKKVKSGYFIPRESACWFRKSASHYESPQTYKHVQTNPVTFDDNIIIGIHIRLENYNDPNDYITKLVVTEDFDSKIYFNDAEIQWMNGKKIFAYVYDCETKNLWNRLEYPDRDEPNPQVCGFIYLDFYFESYYYSLWDVLRTIQLQEIQEYNYQHKDYLFILPNRTETEQGRLLDSIIAPEFNFTNVDVYTAVAQVLSYIDAFPVLDENNVLGFEYLNDLSHDKIVDLEENDTKISLNEQNFSNRLVTNYQNGRTNNTVCCPSVYGYKYIGSNSLGVVNRNDYWFTLDKPIDYIDDLRVNVSILNQVIDNLSYGSVNVTAWYVSFDYPFFKDNIDISFAIFEKEIYDQLPDNFADREFPNKNNTFYYTKGDNKVYAGILGKIKSSGEDEVLKYVIAYAFNRYIGGGLTNVRIIDGTDTNTLRQTLKFNCTYHAIFDGRVSQESTINKVDGETMVAQENSGVDLNRMGNNLQGLIAKLGNEEKTVNLPITEFKDKYKVGTYWEDAEGGKWFINQIKTTFTTDENKVIVDATFTKNFNMLAQYTKINQEKRFYDISTKLTTTGYENINEFIYVSNRQIANHELANNISLYFSAVKTILFDSDESFNKINFASLVTQNNVNSSSGIRTYIPLHSYGNGNQICFEVGFDSPINAGNRIVTSGNSFINKTSLYTDETGFADLVKLECYDFANFHEFSRNFPLISSSDLEDQFKLIEIAQFYYYKKPSEIFHLNYAINFLPYWTKTVDSLGMPIYKYDEIYFGDSFINNSPILEGTEEKRDVYIYVATEKFSMLDNQVRSTDNNLGKVIILVSDLAIDTDWKSYGTIYPKLNGSDVDVSNYVGWCLADRDGNILIAVNNNENSSTIAKLWYFTSRYRKV